MGDEGTTRLSDYLQQLASSEDKLEEYLDDPIAALNSSGLSYKNRFLLLSGDLRQIREVLIQESGGGALFVMIWPPTIWWPPKRPPH